MPRRSASYREGHPLIAVAVMVVGAAAIAFAWRLVAARDVSIWPAMTVTLSILAALSLTTGFVKLSPNVRAAWAAAAGLGAGGVLYLATAAFLFVARRVPMFERGMRQIYDQRRGLSLPAALILAAMVVAPSEEIFWRGLFQGRLTQGAGGAAGATVTLVIYTAANAASASLPVTIGAIVSGAVWGTLAWWTGGVLASILCHSLWTALMVALPPGGRPRPPEA